MAKKKAVIVEASTGYLHVSMHNICSAFHFLHSHVGGFLTYSYRDETAKTILIFVNDC